MITNLDYIASNPDAVVTYKASNMLLAVHSDASYLSETKPHSRVRGPFSTLQINYTQQTT